MTLPTRKSPILRIGTRKSELAQWQAKKVAEQLRQHGCKTELVLISSQGDQDQTTPLSEMGGKGVFTKALDDALLEGSVDMAVHSFKDLPTRQSLPLHVAAVLEREDPRDALVAPHGTDFLEDDNDSAIIATGSTRRRAQWLAKFPGHRIVNLRGNVNTRLQKVETNEWNGAIFAAAGLKRINLHHHITQYLDWMIPAPAQGAMAVMVHQKDRRTQQLLEPLNHSATEQCTRVERELLHVLEAGCSAPVGAYATLDDDNNELFLKAVALSHDGSKKFEVYSREPLENSKEMGTRAAYELLNNGAAEIIDQIRS